MRLRQIEIENFKGIGKKQSIDLKPVTLLFGPNSAGKSTVLQALHYLREIVERHNVDPDQTIAGGLIDFGGFATLVHNHDLTLPIRIKVTIELTDDQGSERLPLNSGGSLNDVDFQELRVRYIVGENTELRDYAVVQEIGVALEIRWSELVHGPYVAVLKVEIDGEPVSAIYSPPQEGRAQLTEFNFTHPFLKQITDPGDIDEPNSSAAQTSENDDEVYFEETASDPMNSPLGLVLRELSREIAITETISVATKEDFRVGIETGFGALPNLDRSIALDLIEVDQDAMQREYLKTPSEPPIQIGRLNRAIAAENAKRRGLTRLLDELVLGPVRIVRDYLGAMTYVGPLREIPTRSFRPRLSPDETRWAQGLAAWDLLYTDTSGKLLDEVNFWLSGEDRLRTGYRLERTEFKEVPVPSGFHQLFDRGLTEDDLGDLQELYATLKARTEIALRDFEKGIIVAPSDVGVGISQMIPVIVSCLRDNDGIVAIEQPELHVHPAIQVGLGDLFIHVVQKDENSLGTRKTLLIETHSEHIMLRLLRRIREATENELPPGVVGLSVDALSVIYVESADDGVHFRPLRVSQDGEFVDRWPKGFFEERAEELF